MRAVRFLFYSNWGFLGKPNTIRFGGNTKRIILKNIANTRRMLEHVDIMNSDFRDMFKRLSRLDENNTFFYCDPPYLDTDNNYKCGFTYQDSIDLFDILVSTKCKWAMSEFNHPFIIEEALKRNLNVIYITERHNIGNRRVEVFITNYKNI